MRVIVIKKRLVVCQVAKLSTDAVEGQRRPVAEEGVARGGLRQALLV